MVDFDEPSLQSRNSQPFESIESSDSEFAFDLRWVQETFMRHWKLGIAAFICVASVVFFIFISDPPQYTATVKLKVESKRPVFNLEEFLNFENISLEFYMAQPNLIQSRRFARNVINQFELWNDDTFTSNNSSPKPSENLNSASKPITLLSGDVDLATTYADPIMSRLVNRYLSGLKVTSERTSPRILYLRYTAKDPFLAANIANAHAEEYIDFSRKSNELFTDEYIDGLSAQLTQIDTRIHAMDKSILGFKKENGFFQLQGVSSYDPIQDIDDRLSRVRQQLAEASNELTNARTDFESVFLPSETGNFNAINPDALDSSTLQTWRIELTKLRKEFAEIEERYGRNYPDYKEKANQINVLEDAIDEEILSLVEKRRIEYERNLSRKNVLDSEEQELIKEKYSRDAQWSELQDLIRTRDQIIDQKTSVVEDIQQAKGSLETQKETRSRIFEIVDYAEVPLSPINRNWIRIVLLTIASALGVAVGAVIFIEFQDRTIRTPQQVEQITGVTVLGVVPLFSNTDESITEGRIDPESLSPAAESMIALRTRFLFSDMVRRSRTILITSSVPGEGKSTVCANLASAISLLGKRVVLVDCDLRKPTLHRFFGEHSSIGLIDVIDGSESLDQALFETDIPGLFLLPAGKTHSMPSEILTSKNFSEMIDSLKEVFDYIFIDTAPVLATPDATILSPQFDSTLLVVRSGKVVKDDLVTSIDHIHRSGGNIFATVLNGVPANERSVYTRHGYGYANNTVPETQA
ncbi:MAG: polysaccharide biosynthesis tyrosine autokinase [Candidatus Hinthialibacter antarcticus]|nr:polysaccharide biosynthesis tyrosine autokinase [Candidatus Hinthialibacter antarcticus]